MPRNLCSARPEHPLARHLGRSTTLWPLLLAVLSVACAAAEALWLAGGAG